MFQPHESCFQLRSLYYKNGLDSKPENNIISSVPGKAIHLTDSRAPG